MKCPKCGGKLEEQTLTEHVPPGLWRVLYRCARCGHMVELSPWQRAWATVKRR